MESQQHAKTRLHILLLGYIGESFLKLLRCDESFETNGVSLTIVERESYIVHLWNVSNLFTDYQIIKRIIQRMSVMLYGINFCSESAFKYIDIIQSDVPQKAIQIFMLQRRENITEEEHKQLPKLQQRYNSPFVFFENAGRDSCLRIIDECVAEYARVMAQRQKDFLQKLFKM